MKTGFRITHLSNFDSSAHAGAYLAIGMSLSIALKSRGFELSDLKSTPAGVATTYDFAIGGVPKLPAAAVTEMAANAVAGNRRYKEDGQHARAPEGIYVTIEFHVAEDANPVEVGLLQSGHNELLNMLKGGSFVPMNANGTDEGKVVMTLGLNLTQPIVYTREMHEAIAKALMNGASDQEKAEMIQTRAELEPGFDTSKRVHKADPRMPGIPKYPRMIFQNAQIGYVLGANTFRLGSKWFDTLKPGDIVEAVDGGGARLGWLKVATVVRDTLASAIRRDALQNHGVKEMEIDNEDEGVEYLVHILEQVYPDTKLDNNTEVSVITFEPQFAPVEPKAFA